MAIQLTQDQITFRNITIPAKTQQAVIAKYDYKDPNGNIIDDEYSGNIQDPAKYINAIDIDWNGAKPGIGEGEDGITTTGELLKAS